MIVGGGCMIVAGSLDGGTVTGMFFGGMTY